VWAAELQWSNWSKVRSGANLFNAIGFAPCVGKDKWDGCTTKDYVGASFAFTPTWYQVFPGVDLSAPMSYSVGLHGNSAVTFGGNEGLGNYAIGLAADVYQKYRFDLKYIDFVGRYKDNGTAVTATNGLTTFLARPGHGQPHVPHHLLRRHHAVPPPHPRRGAGRGRHLRSPRRRFGRRSQGPRHTLTPVGAEKAANKDGTIPAYTGGNTTAPAGYKAGDGIRPTRSPARSRSSRSTPRTWASTRAT
jgi:hypothetical protein